jgi:hypothetical protein
MSNPTGPFQPAGGEISNQTLAMIAQLLQAGNGGITAAGIFGAGNLSMQVSSAGLSPGATGADNVIAAFSIPANVFDQAGRCLYFTAQGSFAANGHNKDLKIIFNPASATVGSTVGGSGTTLIDTGTVTQSGGGWLLEAMVVKYGAANANTQFGLPLGVVTGTTHGGLGTGTTSAQLITATENGAILVAVTGNATTTKTDILLNYFQVSVMN